MHISENCSLLMYDNFFLADELNILIMKSFSIFWYTDASCPILFRTRRQYHIALSFQHYSDSEVLSICSTSPTAEGPDFVDDLRR